MVSLRLLSSFLFVGAVVTFVPNPTLKTTSALQMGQTGQADEEPARVKRLIGELPVPCDQEENFIEVRDFRSLMTHAHAYRYKNSRSGMVVFRGDKCSYAEEKSSLLCLDSTTDRQKSLRRLLEMTVLLQSYYEEEANHYKDGAEMFESTDQDSIVATIRVMALLQQYGDLVENLPTPMMLKTSKDLRVEASLAFQQDREAGRHRVVRALLVPMPWPVHLLEKSKTLWNEKNTRDAARMIQRLGDSDMLLVELEGMLPVSALRTQSRSGYVLVHEKDVKDFHELRKQHAEGKSIDDLMTTKQAKSLIGSDGSDALDYAAMDLLIPDEVTYDQFFDAELGEEVNPYPGLLKAQLNPVYDSMAAIITEVATRLQAPEIADATRKISGVIQKAGRW